MNLQDFLTSYGCHIENVSKIDEVNIEVVKRIEPSGVRVENVSNRKIWESIHLVLTYGFA